jgi:multicomponent Na+:H+ antiporter subunit B
VTRRTRTLVFLAGAAGFAVLLAAAFIRMRPFGGGEHLYRTLAVHAAVAHHTANVVSSVNFDQRGLDTLGEETILLASIIGATVLLRPSREESEQRPRPTGRTLDATRMLGYLLLPVTVIIGLDVVAHGHVTPGGGFQGGVVLATGLHLLYLSGSYPALDQLRPLEIYDLGEALGAGVFAALGLAGIAVAGSFLANIIPTGTFGQLLSGGLVPVLNGAVGVEVACGVVVLLAQFFEQYIILGARADKAGEPA